MDFEGAFAAEDPKMTAGYKNYIKGAKLIWDTFSNEYEVVPGNAESAKKGTNRIILLLEAGKQIASIRIGNEDIFLKVEDELIKYGIDDCYWDEARNKAEFWSTEDCVYCLKEAIDAVKCRRRTRVYLSDRLTQPTFELFLGEFSFSIDAGEYARFAFEKFRRNIIVFILFKEYIIIDGKPTEEKIVGAIGPMGDYIRFGKNGEILD